MKTDPRGSLALVPLIALLACVGCSPKPKITYQYDSKADFASLKTYAVEPTDSPTLAIRVIDGKPMTQVVEESIEQQLDSKGLKQVPPAQADVLVRWTGQIAYDAASSDVATPGVNVDLNQPDSGFLLDSGPPGGEGVPGEITEGGIRIDLVNAKSKKIVWRGGMGSILQPKAPDPERIKRLNEALNKLFESYPPPPQRAR